MKCLWSRNPALRCSSTVNDRHRKMGRRPSCAASDVLAKRMEEELPEVVAMLAEEGIRKVVRTAAGGEGDRKQGWQQMFKTEDGKDARHRTLFCTTDMMHQSAFHVAYQLNDAIPKWPWRWVPRAVEELGCDTVKLNEDGTAEFVYGPP